MPSMSQAISKIDFLLIICDFVQCTSIGVQFADAEEETRGYLLEKLENLRLE